MNLPLSDLHMHTTYCDGKGSAEEMVLSAIAKGYHTVGLSGHSHTPFDTRYCMTEQGEYFAECRRLKEKYADRISVQIGLELEALSEEIPSGLDYLIGSVHYFTAGDRRFDVDGSAEKQALALSEGFGGDLHRLIDNYFGSVVAMVERVRPDVVGHFDLLTKFSEREGRIIDPQDGYYRGAALDALRAVVRISPRLEVNSGAISRGYRTEAYPSDELIRETLREGGRLVLTSDAHAPENIGFAFDATAARLLRLGCDTVDVRRADRFEEMRLV